MGIEIIVVINLMPRRNITKKCHERVGEVLITFRGSIQIVFTTLFDKCRTSIIIDRSLCWKYWSVDSDYSKYVYSFQAYAYIYILHGVFWKVGSKGQLPYKLSPALFYKKIF